MPEESKTYWHYSAITTQNGKDINFSGVVESSTKFFPLKKVMTNHFAFIGLNQTHIGNATEISEEDYIYFYQFANRANVQQMFLS